MSQHASEGLPSPLHQFDLQTLIPLHVAGIDLSLTNATVYMFLAVFLVLGVLYRASASDHLVPTRFESLGQAAYGFIDGMLRDHIGPEGVRFFPLVFSLFLFIVTLNMLGMIPYAYTVTSQIIVTFFLAALVFLVATIVGIQRHGLHFLTMFVPHGVPKALLPLIIPIEIISYCSRPISLSVRLFANMMAGHTMLKVFAGFSVVMGIFGVAPLGINVLLTVFEVMVAFLQAYVFTVLTCLYFKNALELH